MHDALPLPKHQAKWQSLIFACRPVMLYICTKFCEIIWNDIKVIEWTWFLYWKLQRGLILQKDTISILTIYKITKWHKTEKYRRSNSSQSKNGHTFICTKFRDIISNRIKVIELTRFLCQKFKRGIIQQIMLVEWLILISARRLVMLYISTKYCEIISNAIKVIQRTRFLYWKFQRGIIPPKM